MMQVQRKMEIALQLEVSRDTSHLADLRGEIGALGGTIGGIGGTIEGGIEAGCSAMSGRLEAALAQLTKALGDNQRLLAEHRRLLGLAGEEAATGVAEDDVDGDPKPGPTVLG